MTDKVSEQKPQADQVAYGNVVETVTQSQAQTDEDQKSSVEKPQGHHPNLGKKFPLTERLLNKTDTALGLLRHVYQTCTKRGVPEAISAKVEAAISAVNALAYGESDSLKHLVSASWAAPVGGAPKTFAINLGDAVRIRDFHPEKEAELVERYSYIPESDRLDLVAGKVVVSGPRVTVLVSTRATESRPSITYGYIPRNHLTPLKSES